MTTAEPRTAAIDPASSREIRAAAGAARRRSVPLDDHAEVPAPVDRDPLATLAAQDRGRLPELVPIRYGRMLATPFTFYRGGAAVMAADLAAAPHTDLGVQLCGDAHLSNFGVFAAPDRRLVFDVNDFDETLPGPFEWDVKRLAASLVVAGRANGLSGPKVHQVTLAGLGGYRETIQHTAGMDPLRLWYDRIEYDEIMELIRARGSAKQARRAERARAKAGRKNSLRALDRLTEVHEGRRRIVSDPPLVSRLDDTRLGAELDRVVAFFDSYRASLPVDKRTLFDRYALVDLAVKVVGVGSVGTRCLIVLFESGDGDPLFLQLKEAVPSVLEAHLEPSAFDHPGERVVQGQRLVQGTSDTFLGWASYQGQRGELDFYVRQLWDGKLSAPVDEMGTKRLTAYAHLCGVTLARAHARSGDAAAIGGYLGDDDTFDRAVLTFAEQYADLTEADHRRLVDAVDAGAIEVVRDL